MRAYACACAFTTTVNSVRLLAAVGSLFPVPGSRLGLGLVFISLAVPWGSGASNYLAWRLADRAQRQTDKAMVDGREASPLLCLYDFRIRLTYGREQ